MNKHFFRLAFLLLITGVQTFAQGNAKTYLLKFNMAKGQKFSYRMSMDMNIDQSVGGQDIHVNTRIDMDHQFAVVGDSAGWKKLEAVFDRMLMHMNANGQEIAFDTDSSGNMGAASGAITKAMKSFIGQKFYYLQNDKGEIGQITGIKEIASRLKDSVAGQGPMAEGMTQVFNEESFRQNLEQAYKAYPKKPVAIGESWDASTSTVSNGIPMTSTSTYTLSAVNGDIATIKSTGSLKSADGATTQGMPMTMTGTFDGTTDFSLRTGIPVKGLTDMKNDMKIEMQGQTIPIKMNIKMNLAGKQF